MRAQLLFWMLAATDGHAKNFSIRLLAGGRYRLTPLYDVLSAWPVTGPRHDQIHPKKLKLAMALRGTSKHYRLDEITRRKNSATARGCGLGADMESIITDIVAKTPAVIESVGASLPEGFPAGLFASVTKGLQKAAKQIVQMPTLSADASPSRAATVRSAASSAAVRVHAGRRRSSSRQALVHVLDLLVRHPRAREARRGRWSA